MIKRKKNNLRSDTMWLTFSKVVTMLLNMLCVMILSRIRTLEEYGTYSQLIMTTTLMSTLMIMGLPNSINYFLGKAETDLERNRFLQMYYQVNILISFIVGLVLFLGKSILISYYHNESLAQYSAFLLFFPFALLTIDSLSYVLVFYSKTKLLVCFKLFHSCVTLLILVIAYISNITFIDYMKIYLVCESVFAIIVYCIIFRIVKKIKIGFSGRFFWDVFKYALPLGLSYSIGTIMSEVDKLMVSNWFTTEEYAIYSNSARELPIAVIATSTSIALMPRIVKKLKEKMIDEAVNMWKNAFEFNFLIMALLVFGIVCFAPDIMTLLYSEKYLPGVTVFRIYVIILLLRSTSFGMMLMASGHSKMILINSIIVLGLNVLLNIFYYRIIGYEGMALATLTSGIVEMMNLLFMTSKKLNTSILNLVPIKELSIIIGVNCGLSIVFGFIKELISLEQTIGSLGESILLGGVWSVFYFLIFKKYAIRRWKVMGESKDDK